MQEDAQKNRDEALEETFPASDPPAIGGATGPNDKPALKTPPEGPNSPLSQGVAAEQTSLG